MKTNRFIAVALATLFIAAFNACTKEETPAAPEVPGVGENLVELTLTATQYADDAEAEPTSAALKSTFNGAQLGWEADDLVAIYDGTAKRQFTIVSIEGGVATLTGMISPDATDLYAVFPYSAASDVLPTSEGQVSLNLPSVQTLAEGKNFDEDAFVTVGKVQDGNVVLKNAISVLKLNIPEGVSSVRLQGFAYENIAGGVYSSSDAAAAEGEVSSVILMPAGESFAAGEHYIALLPTKFTAGFKVVYSKEGAMAVVKTTTPVEFPRKGGFDITGSTANLTWLANPIMTEEDLLAYVADQSAYAGETAKLGANIALTKAWTPVALSGVLDGQDYTISGLAVEATGDKVGMFTVVETDGALKSVTVEGIISQTSTSATSYAGLVAEVKGAMYKVVNKASVVAASTGGTRTYVGGVAGRISAGASLLECQNYGSVTLNSSSAPSFIGGVAGFMEDGSVQECSNNATVTSNSNKSEGIGGIIGLQQGGKLDTCTNSGTLVPTAAAANSYVGGVTGYVQNQLKKLLTITKCVNQGEISANNVQMAVGGIVGVIHRYCFGPSEIVECVNEKELSASISKKEFYMGGIVGRMANPGNASAIGQFVNNIKDCYSKGNISVTRTSTEQTSGVYVGGILGIALGTVELVGNKTLAEMVSLSDGYANNSVTVAGGIVAKTDDTSVTTLTSNVNKSAVTCASTRGNNYRAISGGLIGICMGTLTSSNNINFGDVTVSNKNGGSNKNPMAGGLYGELQLSTGETASLTGDKTFGYVYSDCGRAGLCSAVANATVVAKDCVVGGKLNCPTNQYLEKEITSDNFDDNKNLLMSYSNNWTAISNSGLTFGVAADYDK